MPLDSHALPTTRLGGHFFLHTIFRFSHYLRTFLVWGCRMPRPKAECGTYSAYKRHLRDGEPVDEACRQASVERSREQVRQRREAEPEREPRTPPPSYSPAKSRKESLEWNLGLIESAMADVESAKLAPLSKRHSELLAELAALSAPTAKEADPFDEFFSGDLSNVARFPASADREAS